MAGLPTVQVLLDDGTGTFPFDVTAYVQTIPGYGVSRGRQDEMSSVTAGQLTGMTVDNTDGRFTVGSTLIATPSPIVANQRVRVAHSLVTNTTFEIDVSGYTPSNSTLARSTAQKRSGAASMSVTATAAATAYAIDTAAVPVSANGRYQVVAWTRAATVARSIQIQVAWYDASMTLLGSSFGSLVADTTTGWTRIEENFAPLAGAAFAQRYFVVNSPGAGEVHYVDDYTFNLNRFTGYVQQWPVTFPDGSDQSSFVQVIATDAQARAGDRWPLKSVIEQETLNNGPFAIYTFGDPTGATTAADSSGNQYPSLVNVGANPVVFGNATGLPKDGLTAATFVNTSALSAAWPTPAGTGWSYLVFFNSAGPAAIDSMVMSKIMRTIATTVSVNLSGAGKIEVPGFGAFGPFGSSLNNSLWHAFGISVDGSGNYVVMIDAATAATGTNAGLVGMPVGLQAGSALGGPVSGLGDAVGYAGSLAHGILVATALSAANLNAIAQAGLTGFAGEAGTTRITRLAGYASLPVGTFDASLTNVPFVDITGKAVMAAIQDVADAEFGLVFFDGSGNLVFHNRNRVVSKTAPDVTIDANFLDVGTAFIYDMQGVLNYFEVTALGTTSGAQVIENQASRSAHGKYSGSASYLVQTDQEALDRGNWVVSNHAQPAPRVGSLVIDVLTMTAAQQAAMVALEPNIWLRVTGLPGQTPGGTTADFIVQGFTEKVTATEWTITANAANRSLFQAWILDSTTYSVLDSTTRVFV